jgi:hypothetical protein
MRPIFEESLIKVFISAGITFINQLPAISSSIKRLIETGSIPFTSRNSLPHAKRRLLKVRGGFIGGSHNSPIKIIFIY